MSQAQVAAMMGLFRRTVAKWRDQYVRVNQAVVSGCLAQPFAAGRSTATAGLEVSCMV